MGEEHHIQNGLTWKLVEAVDWGSGGEGDTFAHSSVENGVKLLTNTSVTNIDSEIVVMGDLDHHDNSVHDTTIQCKKEARLVTVAECELNISPKAVDEDHAQTDIHLCDSLEAAKDEIVCDVESNIEITFDSVSNFFFKDDVDTVNQSALVIPTNKMVIPVHLGTTTICFELDGESSSGISSRTRDFSLTATETSIDDSNEFCDTTINVGMSDILDANYFDDSTSTSHEDDSDCGTSPRKFSNGSFSSTESDKESDFLDFSFQSDNDSVDLEAEFDHIVSIREPAVIENITSDDDSSVLKSFSHNGNSNIMELSPEVLLLIFSNCSMQDLKENVSQVCMQWNELASRPCLQRELRLSGSSSSTSEVCCMLERYPNLILLEIEERNDVDAILTYVAIQNQRLRRLIIKKCWNPLQYDVVSYSIFYKLLMGCPRLSSITIKKCPFSGFFEVFHGVKEFLGQIRKLNLNFVDGLQGAEDICLLAGSCSHLEDFRALTRSISSAHHFYVCKDEDLRILCSRVCNTLQVLKIEGDDLSDDGMVTLAQCSLLTKLCLRRIRNITDIGLLELTRLEKLTSLELMDVPRPTTQGWKQLFQRCCWVHMHTLLLARCMNADDEALLWVAYTCKELRRLSIAGCYLATSKGLKVVFRACPIIEELTLCLSQTRGCVFWIPALVPNLKKIVYHSCYRVNPTQNAKEEHVVVQKAFEKKYPDLKIIYIESLNDLMVVS